MKSQIGPQLLVRALRYGLAAIAAAYLVLYFFLAWKRVFYPFELEWMEGGSVDHVLRLLAGKQIYVEPSLDFVPYIYPPLYYYVSMVFAWLFEPGLASLRLVSILASLGCFLVIFEFVRRETKSLYYGVIAAGLFAATYRVGGAWLDIARVDSLFLLLLLGSAFLLRFYDTFVGLVISAILISLAVLTKQTALPIAIGMSVYCLIFLPGWKRLVFPVSTALGVALSTLGLNAATDGWYYYYVYQLPQAHQIVRHIFITFWTTDMGYLLVAVAISLTFILYLLYSGRKRQFGFYLFFLGATTGAAWLSKLQMTSYDNVRLPPYMVIAICFGLGFHALISGIETASQNDPEIGMSKIRLLYEPFILLICVLQFVSLFYNPLQQIPSRADLAAGNRLIQTLQNTEGEVFLPLHGFIPSLAGKQTFAQDIAMADVLRHEDDEAAEKLRQQLVDAIRNKRFQTIILDQGPWRLEAMVEQEYGAAGQVFAEPDVFWPVTGMQTRPARLYQAPE